MTDLEQARLERTYTDLRASTLEPLAERLANYLRTSTAGTLRIDRISARAKSVERFIGKALKLREDGRRKYSDPLHQIQDQVGARIVTFYLSDVVRVSEVVEKYLRPIETQAIVPDSETEFGYFGKHYILIVPTDVYDEKLPLGSGPRFFELQIKTLFQHAWSEAEHDLGYKPAAPLTAEQKRRIAFTSAQAWGADRMFDELHREMPGALIPGP